MIKKMCLNFLCLFYIYLKNLITLAPLKQPLGSSLSISLVLCLSSLAWPFQRTLFQSTRITIKPTRPLNLDIFT